MRFQIFIQCLHVIYAKKTKKDILLLLTINNLHVAYLNFGLCFLRCSRTLSDFFALL